MKYSKDDIVISPKGRHFLIKAIERDGRVLLESIGRRVTHVYKPRVEVERWELFIASSATWRRIYEQKRKTEAAGMSPESRQKFHDLLAGGASIGKAREACGISLEAALWLIKKTIGRKVVFTLRRDDLRPSSNTDGEASETR